MGVTRFLFVVCLLGFLLSSCGRGESEDAAAEVDNEQPPATYGQIDDLVQAVDDAGLQCSTWTKPLRERLAADSRYCEDGDSIAAMNIYASGRQMQRAIGESVQFAELYREENSPELVASLLVGENWIVEATLDDVRRLEPELGGVVQDNSCAVVSSGADGC
ncbi:MAG: hypothetical protein WA966_14830 [Ornithinimicrobium sp.]